MSVLWIVIIGYAVLSTILVVGLSLWWYVMEHQEHESFSNLVVTKRFWWRLMGKEEHETFSKRTKANLEAREKEAKKKLEAALEQYPEKKPEDAIIAVLSELPFPLQKYAENVEERRQIEKFMIEVVTELKNREEPKPSSPSTNSSATT